MGVIRPEFLPNIDFMAGILEQVYFFKILSKILVPVYYIFTGNCAWCSNFDQNSGTSQNSSKFSPRFQFLFNSKF